MYSGDLSASATRIYQDANFSGGAYLRYRPIPRIGIRINGNFGKLSSDRMARMPDEDGRSVLVLQSFQSKLTEFNLLAEIDLFYLGDPEANYFAPYLFGGVGVFSFDPKAPDQDGNLVSLQPLRTEGQGLAQINPRYAAAPYNLTEVVGIVGGGIRLRFAERFVVGLELGGRITGTDYIDDIGGTLVNYRDILGGQEGSQAAFFSNPAVDNPTQVTNLEYTRGGNNPDWYFVGGLTFGITIGEGGRGKGCYNF